MTDSRTVSQTRAFMSEVMTPNDANFLGKVFGGRILSLLDYVAYVCSSRFAGGICVTASFDQVDFHHPIEVGELVTCEGCVSYVGRTSMEITVEVYAENLLKSTKRHTNTARMTMVAIDENGRPRQIPRLVCETRDEKIRFLEGKLRRSHRGAAGALLAREAESFRNATDEELDALLRA